MKRSLIQISAWLTLLAFAVYQPAYALPTGYEVIAGDATFEQVGDNTLNITASQNSIINYASFNIAENEIVNFFLPAMDAFSLNRVLGDGASQIFGALNSNGNLMLVNTSGIHFGSTAEVNVGGLIASAHDITNENFLAGNYLFAGTETGLSSASILNEGMIAARDGGFAVFAGDAIENRGTVEAPLGTVALAAGDLITIGISGDGMVSIGVDQATAHGVLDENGNPITDQIKNSGTLSAASGKVSLNAKAIDQIFQKAVNITGLVQADSVVVGKDGVVEMVTNGINQNSGSIRAKTFTESGYTFINTETGLIDGGLDENANIIVGTSYYDNIDGAANLSGNIGSNQTDVGDLIVTGNVTLTANDLVFTADSDNNGVGQFNMNDGFSINGSGSNFNLTIRAGQNSTLKEFTNMGTLTVGRAGSNSTPTFAIGISGIALGGLAIESSTTFSMSGAELTFSSAAAVSNSGTVLLRGDEVFTNVTNLDVDSGTVRYSGGASTTYTVRDFGATDYYNLILTGFVDTTLQFDAAKVIAGNVTVQNATVQAGANAVTVNGNFTVDTGSYSYTNGLHTIGGNLSVDPGATGGSTFTAGSGNLDIAGDLLTGTGNITVSSGTTFIGGNLQIADSATFSTNSGTLNFDGSGTQLFDSGDTATMNHVTHSGSGTLRLTDQLTTSGHFTNSAGIFSLNSYSLSIGGNESNSGTIQLRGDESIMISGTHDVDSGTWEYIGTNGQNYTLKDFGATDYYNLKINSTGGSDSFDIQTADLTVAGALTVTAGSLHQGAGTGDELVVTGLTTLNGGTMNLAAYMTATLTGGLNFSSGSMTAPTTLNIGGNWAHSGGSFTHNSGTVVFNGGNQTISGSTTFYNLTKTDGSNNSTDLTLTFDNTATQTIANGGTLTLTGIDADDRINLVSDSPGTRWELTCSTCTLSINWADVTDSDASAGSTITHSNTISGGNNLNWGFGITSTWTGALSSVWSLAGNWNNGTPGTDDTAIIADVTTDPILDTAVSITALTISSGGLLSLAGFGLTVSGAFSNDGTVQLRGSESISLTQDINSGTWQYVGDGVGGTGTFTLRDFGATDYYNLVINMTDSAEVVQSAGAKVIAGAMTVTSGSYDINNNATTVAGLATVNGGTYYNASATPATQTFNGGLTISSGTFDSSSDQVVDINGAFNQSGGVFTAPGASVVNGLTISGNFTRTAGTFNHNSGTVIFDGGTVNLTSGGAVFNNVTIGTDTASGGVSLVDDIDINGTLAFNTTGGTASLISSNRTVNYAGSTLDLTNADTFTTTGSTWIFDGTTTLTSAGKSFNNVTVGTNSASGSLTLGDTTDINGTLAFNTTGGTAALDASSRTVNYAGSTLDLTNADTFTTTGSTWIFDGTTSLTSAGKTFNNVTIGTNSASGSLTLGDTTDINGTLAFNTTGGTAALDSSNRTVSYAGGTLDLTNADTFTTTGSTWIFDGTTSLTSGGKAFNNMTLGSNTTSGMLTLSDDLDVNGILAFNTTGGSAALTATNRTVNYAGSTLDLTNADMFTTTGSTFIFDGTTSLTSAGKSFNNVTIGTNSASGSLTLGDTTDINGTLAFNTTGGTAALDSSNRTVNYAGSALDLTNADTFTTTGSTFIFDGTTSLTSAGKSFNNVTIGTNAASGSLTLGDTTDINGTLAFNTTGGTAALDASSRTVNYAGSALDLTNADTFTTTGSTFIFDGTTSLTSAGKSFNNVTVGTNSASGSLTLADTTDINGTLAFNTTGGTTALDITNISLAYAGTTLDFTNLDSFTSTGSTFRLDAAADQALTMAGKSLNHFTVNNTGAAGSDDITFTGDLDVNGIFTLTDGNFHAPANMTVGDDFLFDGGSFDANNGLVTLDTAATATVDVNGAGPGSISFFDFSIIAGGKSVNFGTGDTFNVLSANTWTVAGTSGNNVTLNSTGGGQFNINPAGTNLTNTTINNANNTSGIPINCGTGCVSGSGNTGGWNFAALITSNVTPTQLPSSETTHIIDVVETQIPGGFDGPVVILIPESGEPVVIPVVESTPPTVDSDSKSDAGSENGNGGGPGGDPDGGGGGGNGGGKKSDFQDSGETWDLFNQIDRTKYKTVVLVYEGKVFVENFDAKGKSQGGGVFVKPNMKTEAEWNKEKTSILKEPEAAKVSGGCINGEGEKCKALHTYKK